MKYIDFEGRITRGLEWYFHVEPNPEIKEDLREKVLELRCFARDTWIKMGNEVPPNYKFKDNC